MNFTDLGLSPEVLRAISDAGYETPTPIQAQAIPVLLMGRDMLGCAQTGTGKTASFTLPMIDILARGRAKARMPRSLIIEPTRELAAQVAESFDRYGKYHKLSKALLVGGESFTDQQRLLDRGVDVLIATPGRLLDLYERGKILMSDVKILVIDEADRMLDMGFIPDVEKIVSLLPPLRQTLFFSATMPPEIRRLADAFLQNPKEISVSPPATPAMTVVQGIVVVPDAEKREGLRRLLRTEDVKNALIFCNRKREVDVLHRSLQRHGFDAAAIHGDMPQSKRTETLERFRQGDITLLVASDVAARGLDIVGLSHVFNFDVPHHAEDYVHRIGRTGRAGREGRAFTLATPADGRFIAAIEKLIGKDLPRISIEGMEPQGFDERRADQRGGRGRGGRSKPASDRKPPAHRADTHRADTHKPREHKPAEPALPVAVPSAAPAEVIAPESLPPRDRHREPHRGPRRDHRPTTQPHAKPPAAQPQPRPSGDRGRGRHPAERTNEPPVLAFGDHMPDFLRQPVQVPSPPRKKADAA